MRISVVSLGAESGSRFLAQVRLAELLGYHAFFHNDKKWARDVYVRLGAATGVTSRLGLGISVTDPYTRHPALTAQATATLAEMAPGRFRVIMGAGSHFETLPGSGNTKPVIGIREGIALMRQLWKGERVTLDGKVVKFKDGALDYRPTATPPVYIASRGPLILKLAGEIADGVLIGSFATPPGIEYAKQHIEKGLRVAGRGWKDVQLCSWIYLSLLDHEDEPVPESIRRGVSFAFWSSRKVLLEMADELAGDVTEEFRKFVQEAPHEWSPQIMAELRRLIPRGLIDSLAVVGTSEQVVDRLRSLEAAGVQEVVIWPFPKENQETEDLLVTLANNVMPHVSERRPREA